MGIFDKLTEEDWESGEAAADVFAVITMTIVAITAFVIATIAIINSIVITTTSIIIAIISSIFITAIAIATATAAALGLAYCSKRFLCVWAYLHYRKRVKLARVMSR